MNKIIFSALVSFALFSSSAQAVVVTACHSLEGLMASTGWGSAYSGAGECQRADVYRGSIFLIERGPGTFIKIKYPGLGVVWIDEFGIL